MNNRMKHNVVCKNQRWFGYIMLKNQFGNS